MDPARYSKAELCLIHLATALAAGGERGEAADLLKGRAAAVLRQMRDPSPHLVWLVGCLRDALGPSATAGHWWRLQLAVAELSIRRADTLFDPAWEAAHAPR
jgi:hypothetical protein